ncbi:MAG: Ig-like domain-containing protein [bacterium]|nr:Ig-like domain-containing protein [bacterium]
MKRTSLNTAAIILFTFIIGLATMIGVGDAYGVSLTSPINGVDTIDATPFFQWTHADTPTQAILQIDDRADFLYPLEFEVNILFTTGLGTTMSYALGNTQALLANPDGTAKRYYWRVIENESTISSVQHFDITCPVLVSPTDGSETYSATPVLDWEDVAGLVAADSWLIQVDKRTDFLSRTEFDPDGSAVSWPKQTTTAGNVSTVHFGTSGDSALPNLPYARYYWRVMSYKGGTPYSNWSSWSTWSFDIKGPILMSPVEGVSTDNNQPTFFWNAVDEMGNGDTYTLQVARFNNKNDFNNPLATIYLNGAITNYTWGTADGDAAGTYAANNIWTTAGSIANLTEGTYFWRVMAQQDSGDTTPWSYIWRFVVDLDDVSPPDAPTPQSPACGDRQRGDITFSWSAVSDPSSSPSDIYYQVQIDHDASFSIPDSEDVDINETTTSTSYATSSSSSVDTYLAEGIWFWRVRAVDPTNDYAVGNWSSVCSVVIDRTPPDPTLLYPGGSDTSACSAQIYIKDCTPTLSWKYGAPAGVALGGLDEPEAIKFQIELTNLLGVTTTYPSTTTYLTRTTYVVPTCLTDSDTRAENYRWRVTAYDDAGNSSTSTYFYFIVDTRAPTPPQTLSTSPGNGDYWTDGTPTFIWNEGDTKSSLTNNINFVDFNEHDSSVVTVGTDLRYDFQLDTNKGGFSSPIVDVENLTTPTYTTSLSDGTYMWRVRAIDCAGNYTAWKTQVLIIDTVPPCTPTLLSPSHGGTLSDTPVEFDWADVSDATLTSYELQVDTNSSFTLAPGIIDQFNTGTPPVSKYTSKAADNLNTGTTYYWRVIARDKAGNTCWSPVWSFSISTTIPADPTLRSPANNTCTNDQTPTFDWDELDSGYHTMYYIFELDGNDNFTDADISVSGLTESTYTLPPAYALSEGHYYWRVIAVDEAGNKGYGHSMLSFTVDLTPPDAPAYVYPTDNCFINDDTPKLDWSEPESALSYQIQIDDDGDFSSPVLNVTADSDSSLPPGGTSEMTISPALPEGTWYWRVRAIDCAGNMSGWSVSSSYAKFTIDTTAPDGPYLISPSDYAVTNDKTPTFDWADVKDAVSAYSSELSGNYNNSKYCPTVYYIIQIETDENVTNVPPGDGFNAAIEYSSDPNDRDPHDVYQPDFFNGSSMTPTMLPNITNNGRTFFWRVMARDCAGNESTWSDIWAIRIDPNLDSAPSLVSPDNGTWSNDNTPYFDWSDEDDAIYTLQVDNNVDFSSPEINDSKIKTSSYVSTAHLRDGTYYWRVRSTDSAGNVSPWSSDVWVLNIDANIVKPINVPILVTPADNGCISDSTPIFDWNGIGDKSAPVVYTIQVVKDSPNFSSPETMLINISELSWYSEVKQTIWPADVNDDNVINETDYAATTADLAGLDYLVDGTYYWRVKAFDQAANETHWSSVSTFTLKTAAPAVPSPLSPTNGGAITNSLPTFQWNEVADADYLFQLDRDADFSSPEISEEIPKGTTEFTLTTPLELNQTYYWRVAAVACGGAQSAFSTGWSLMATATYINRILDNAAPYDDRVIADDTIWTLSGSPYIIEDLVLVTKGVTLTIEPGVVVYFRPISTLPDRNQPTDFIVQGTLKAEGTKADHITFTTWPRPEVAPESDAAKTIDGCCSDSPTSGSNNILYIPQCGDWQRIRFESTSTGSVLKYADISYGGLYNDGVGTYYRGNIEIDKTSVVIDHVSSTNSCGYGLLGTSDITAAFNNTFSNSVFSDNGLDGIDLKVYAGTINITGCTIERNGRWGILNEGNYNLGNITDLVVTDCTINDNGLNQEGGGIFSTATHSEDITNNTIEHNAGWAIIKGQHRLGDSVGGYVIADNTLTGNYHNGIWIKAKSHTGETTWSASNQVFYINRVIVEKGAGLTIKAGVVVKLSEDQAKKEGAGLDIYGTLTADGTSASPIVITSYYDDDFGGDTNFDGSSAGKIADDGDWQAITFHPASSGLIDNCTIRYSEEGIAIDNASPTITDSTISDNTFRAVGIRGVSAPIIRGNTLRNNDHDDPDNDQIGGAITTFCDENAAPVIENNTIYNNRNYAIGITANNAGLIKNNNIIGNRYNAIKVCSGITKNVTWSETSAPFYVSEALSVGDSPTWTIQPGVKIKSSAPIYINKAAKLVAIGNKDKPIIFTSYRDDSVGGDTNADDDYAQAAIGDWGGIAFNDGTTEGTLEYVEISYGANGLDCASASPAVTHATIAKCGTGINCRLGAAPVITRSILSENNFGLYSSTGSNPTIGGSADNLCEIINNINGGVINTHETVEINATYNWWGDKTGPKDTSKGSPLYNPNGFGDMVSDFVSYRPWDKTGHAPTANAGQDINATAGNLVMLDASASSDPDGNSLIYIWAQIGTDPEVISLTNVVRPTFTPQTPGNYKFQLVVVDSDGNRSLSDEVTVTVSSFTGPGVSNVKLRLDKSLPLNYYSKKAGETFEVKVYVGDSYHSVVDLFALAFTLNYTRTEYLDFVKAEAGSFLDDDLSKLLFYESNNDPAGKIEIGISRKKGIHGSGASGFDENKPVVKITFKLSETVPVGEKIDLSFSDVMAKNRVDNTTSLKPVSSQIKVTEGLVKTVTVWPGDTNNDGQVGAKDVLPIGLYWKSTGTARTSAQTSWIGQQATAWSPVAATYADANGDGIVDAKDVLAVGLNWHKTHTVYSSAPALAESNMIDWAAYLPALREMYEALGSSSNTELRDVLAEYINLAISNQVPAKNQLLQSYPNPFNPEAWIPFKLADGAEVAINIYNLSGQLVRSFDLGQLSSGSYLTKDRAAYWDGRDENGSEVSSGAYLYQLRAGSYTATRKMIVLK